MRGGKDKCSTSAESLRKNIFAQKFEFLHTDDSKIHSRFPDEENEADCEGNKRLSSEVFAQARFRVRAIAERKPISAPHFKIVCVAYPLTR
jgi:hypothetical protein